VNSANSASTITVTKFIDTIRSGPEAEQLADAELYTREAEQRRLAEDGMRKLTAIGRKNGRS
jgi:hypothetical protein